jgi:hypothetical protein
MDKGSPPCASQPLSSIGMTVYSVGAEGIEPRPLPCKGETNPKVKALSWATA